jgi:hypothetical protein
MIPSVTSTRKSRFDFVGSWLRVLQCNDQADKLRNCGLHAHHQTAQGSFGESARAKWQPRWEVPLEQQEEDSGGH